MKLRYDGPLDEVEVPELGVSVLRGHQIEATGKAAESLAKQTDWSRVTPPKTRKTRKATTTQGATTTNTTEE